MTRKASAFRQRAVARMKVFKPGEMTASAAARRVHLLDISRSGALVHCDVPPPIDSIIQLSCERTLGSARVVWGTGKRFGVVFAAWLTQEQLDTLVNTGSTSPERTAA